jgi:Na+/H+-dicarboxylate symporter
MKLNSCVQFACIAILSANVGLVHSWTNEEFEMFDLVEELNSANFYEFLGVAPVGVWLVIGNFCVWFAEMRLDNLWVFLYFVGCNSKRNQISLSSVECEAASRQESR